jgi:hypothetical protein
VIYTSFPTNLELSLSELEAQVSILSASVIPRAEFLKNEYLTKVYSVQRSNVILARSLFLLIYALYLEDRSHRLLTVDDILSDILIKPTAFVDDPNPLLAQVLSGTIKQICQNPSPLIQALAGSKIPHAYFAFSVFPSIFAFYTSSEFCESAGRLLIQFVRSEEIHPDLLYFLCLSFLFSAFAFCDTLWRTLQAELSKRVSFSRDETGSAMIHAICHSLPLLSTGLHDLIRVLEAERPSLMTHVVARWLKISFAVWWNRDGEGIGFAPGDSILEYLRGITDGSSVDVTSALVGNLGECPVLPSYIGVCGVASETLIFSGCDCQLLAASLRPVASQIPMFDTLERLAGEAGADRFAPIAIKVFAPASSKKALYPLLFPIPSIDHIRCEPDPIFEQAYHQKASLRTREFLKYALFKDATRCHELAMDQELAMTLAQQLKIATDLQRSLLRLRAAFYEEWVSGQRQDFSGGPLERATAFLSRANDRDSLIATTVLQFASKAVATSVPQDLIDSCLAFSRARFRSIWTRVGTIGESRFVQRLIPMVVQRHTITWPQVFTQFSYLFNEIRTIAGRIYGEEGAIDGIIIIMEIVFLCANADRPFRAFLVLEKTLFRQGEFMRELNKAVLADWTQFFKMMLTVLAENPQLLDRCICLDVSDTGFV